MKKYTFPICTFVYLCFFLPVHAQQTMPFTSSSDYAKKLVSSGMMHLVNVEYEEAYDDFDDAVKLDPNFALAHFFKGRLSFGESRTKCFAKAQQTAANTTDAEKLLISIADTSLDQKGRHEIFTKLRNMYPEDPVLEDFYVMSEPDSASRVKLLEEQVAKFPNSPEVYNQMGYYYMMAKKDNAKAKECFEKYLAMYPDGYNPYDSMGEYYLNTGDKENAKKYYMKSLERCPSSFSSQTKYQELTKDDKK